MDWEDWNDALHTEGVGQDLISEPTLYLLDLLDQYRIKAIFYTLFITELKYLHLHDSIVERGHVIKSHGLLHYRNQRMADRQPYQFLGFCGGFWMRFLPYWLWKFFVLVQKHCYVHPHDLMRHHPVVSNRLLNWKRQFGLKQSRLKLERLFSEVKFDQPSDD